MLWLPNLQDPVHATALMVASVARAQSEPYVDIGELTKELAGLAEVYVLLPDSVSGYTTCAAHRCVSRGPNDRSRITAAVIPITDAMAAAAILVTWGLRHLRLRPNAGSQSV